MSVVMRRYLTEGEQAILLKTIDQFAAVHARRDSAWIRLLLCSGMRVGEFSVMSVGDADLAMKTGYIFIPKERRKGWNRKPRTNKAGKEVVGKPPQDLSVLVTQPVRAALIDLLLIRREMGDIHGPDASLVLSRKQQGMTVRAYQQRVSFWAIKAGLHLPVSPHWFRHTRAMNIMRKTTSHDPRGVVQGALGHASIASSGIYTKLSREDLAAALTEVDGKPVLRKRDMRRAYEGRVGL